MLMFKNKPFFILCVLGILFSCKKEVSITFSENNLTSENNSIVEVNIPLVNENNDIGKSINSAIKDYVIDALQIGESDIVSNSVEETIESFNQEYSNFANEFPDSAQEWEAQIDGEVIFKTQDIISVSLTSYTSTGGAHGNLNISFLNFDATTGELIENSKLFTDIDVFKTIAENHFNTNLEDEDVSLDEGTFQLPKNIGYSEDGIILLYNTYEIAPYSTGIIEFVIPFEEVNSLLIFKSS